MNLKDVLNKADELFSYSTLKSEVKEVVNTLKTPFIPSQVLGEFAKYEIYTYEQLEPYLSDFKKMEVRIADSSWFPVYYKNETEDEVITFKEDALGFTIDAFKLCREHDRLSKSHKQIIALLTFQPLTLSQVQYGLDKEQSPDGVRGRISELVDMGYIKRYYFTIENTETSENRSFVYHYLTNTELKVVDFIENNLEANKHLKRIHLGDDIKSELFELLASKPLFVVDLAEHFKMSESNMLTILREFNSSGLVKLFYQSILSDGKNGKFIAYLPELDVELQILMDEVFKFFGHSGNNSIEKFQNLNRTKTLSFDEIVKIMGMSETLTVAYLTNLRKKNKAEQFGETVRTSTFKIK